jgi:hypothetical protein
LFTNVGTLADIPAIRDSSGAALSNETAYCEGVAATASTNTFEKCTLVNGVYIASSVAGSPNTCNGDVFSGTQSDCETKRKKSNGKVFVAATEVVSLSIRYDTGCGDDGYCNDSDTSESQQHIKTKEECLANQFDWVAAVPKAGWTTDNDNALSNSQALNAAFIGANNNEYSAELKWSICRNVEVVDNAANDGHLSITEDGDGDDRTNTQKRHDLISTTITQNKCKIGPLDVTNGTWVAAVATTLENVPGKSYKLMNNGSTLNLIACDTGFSLDRDQTECTVTANKRVVKIQQCTSNNFINENTGSVQEITKQPQVSDKSKIGGKESGKPCRFFPPNMIFNDDLVVGFQLDTDGTIIRDTNAGTAGENNPNTAYFDENTGESRIRVVFNKDVLDGEVADNYDYFILKHSNEGGKQNFENEMPDSHTTALLNDDLLTDIVVSTAGDKAVGGGPITSTGETEGTQFEDQPNYDHPSSADTSELVTSDECEGSATESCVKTVSLVIKKQYEVVIGAASKCFAQFDNKEHVFIRAKYQIISEFELKYAPGVNLGSSGFTEVANGVWARNRISDSEPTVLLHSDYAEPLSNKVKASQTVKHAALEVKTSLDLLTNPASSSDGGVTENNGYTGELGAGEGVCSDHGQDDGIAMAGSGDNNTSGNIASETSTYTESQHRCYFRSAMVIYQAAININGADAELRMASTLSQYVVDLAVAQYAQYNPYNAMVELQSGSRIPEKFMGAISDPDISQAAGLGDTDNSATEGAEDVRFDVCRCRAEQTSNAQHNGGGLISGNETNLGSWKKGCRYNLKLSDALKNRNLQYTKDAKDDGLVHYITDKIPSSMPAKYDTVENAITNGITGDIDKVTGTRTFQNTDDTTLENAGGIFAACTYSPFFPEPWVYTPYSYVRSWYEFGQARHIDHENHENENARRLMRGNRVLEAKETKKAPPSVQHSLYFKFKK